MINMKVKVYVKSSAKAQEKYYEQVIAEAYAENEALFQKTRDLERQIVCMERDFQAMKKKHSDACADRDNLEAAYKQVQASISQIVRNFEVTRKELEGEVKRVCKEKQELYAQLEDAAMENTALETRLEEVTAELLKHEMGHYKCECEEWKQAAGELSDNVNELNDLLNAERRKTRRLESDMVEANEALEELEDTKRLLEACREQLVFAHERIAEQQKTIVDCSDTITTLKTTAELRPQFSNLWQLLKDAGMIIDTEGGVHNHE
jgi:chromosome segregation ATPase